MSSILRALQRAEQDCHDQENDNRSSSKLNTRTILNSRMQQQGRGSIITFKQVVFSMCFSIVILSISYFLFFPNKNSQPELFPRENLSQPSLISSNKKTIKGPPALPKPHPKKIIATTIPPPSSNQNKNTEALDNNPSTDIIPMEKGILKIQAISWAEDPVSRIAVINNKIVGEGELVKSYRIITIGKDEVILRLSDQNFKLSFKYR